MKKCFQIQGHCFRTWNHQLLGHRYAVQTEREKELLNYEKYYGVSLSREGQRLALELIRNIASGKSFFVPNFDLHGMEVHEIAEQLEHVQSDELIHRLMNSLGTQV